MIILGIETSCDETALAIIDIAGTADDLNVSVLGSLIHSQIEDHIAFGGVVPNIAKREHQKYLPILLDQLLVTIFETSNIEHTRSKQKIDAIAVTVGPGLEPALWTGIVFAQTLAKQLDTRLIGANHMDGHIVASLISDTHVGAMPSKAHSVKFPALSLLVSGGHTELILLQSWTDKRKIGATVDDAAGEAFDKVARILGLPYPGGPQISRLAEKARASEMVQPTRFPRPMLNSGDYNFSFSGLKTAVLYYVRKLETKNPLDDYQKTTIAREFEDAVVETLVKKTTKALDEYCIETLIVGGGVSANQHLRSEINDLNKAFPTLAILLPSRELSTDNAIMIAVSGYLDFIGSDHSLSPPLELHANGNLSI